MAYWETPDRQLWDAALDGNIERMKTALFNGADINWKDSNYSNWTPLHAAAIENNIDAVQWLLSKGADLESRNDGGYTPLIRAAAEGHSQVVTMLLEKGADVAATTIDGETALDIAEQYGYSNTVTLLRVHSEVYRNKLLKALKEGRVTVKYSKFSLSGPPGSGKSSVLKLLNDEDPVLTHDSTPVVAEPTPRQLNTTNLIEGGGRGDKEWNILDLKSLKAMAAKQLKIEKPSDKDDPAQSTHKHTDHSSFGHSSISSPSSSTPLSDTATISKVSQEVLDIPFSDLDSFPSLGEVHWIYGVDSGGQAAFLDIAPALLRYNSVNILLHKLKESLSDQPQFFYSVNGDTVGKPIKRQMTHLQFLHSSIRSLASVPSCSVPTGFATTNISQSIFLILGSFLDEIGKESLAEKNEILWNKFEDYVREGLLKAYRVVSESIIYPVVTIDRGDEAKAIAKEIRSLIRERYIEASVPIRWFLFQLELKENHQKSSIIAKSTCIEVGHSLGMDPEDVEAALQYYHDLTIILYFPSVLPHVVFLHPQPLFKKLSDLISVSFTDIPVDLEKVKPNHSIPDPCRLLLKKEGKFDKKLLECLSEGFTKDFSSSDFFSLMESLLIIGPLEEDQYFIPCVLETCAVDVLEKMRGQFNESCDPLVLSWEENIIPQGMYPALVVSLLKEGFKMLFKKQTPYRNAIKLQSTDLGVNILLVDTILWLEIHCDGPAGPVQDACPKLRVLVHRSIQSVSSKFSYSSNTLEGTLCQACTAGVCRRNKAGTSITCTNGVCSKAREIGPRQSCWFTTDPGASADKLLLNRSKIICTLPVEKSNEVQIKADTSDNLLDKKPRKSDLIRLFKDSAAHYMLIGTALDVKVDDLLPIPGAATTNLILVFQRWIDSNKEVTWRKVLQICDDFPNELGKVKADVEAFLSSDRAPHNGTSACLIT